MKLFSQLIVGQSYEVYGVMCLNARIDYLICAESAGPDWIPGSLFEIEDPRIVEGWSMCYVGQSVDYQGLWGTFGVVAICGYARLTGDFPRYCGILERNSTELEFFYKEKQAADLYFSNTAET